jgi:hypothetical protein
MAGHNDRSAEMSDWETFKQYNAIADELLAAASKEQIAEAARILALNVAHFKARFGDAPTDNLGAMIDVGKVNAESAAMLASGMENFVGVLATVMGLDRPEKMN